MKSIGSRNKKIPTNPGVYFFLGKKKEILYIGRATSLRSRINSYFSADIAKKRSTVIEKMVQEAIEVVWTKTDSVLEAMLLEVNLIRTHRPQYNTRSKDDKSYNHLVITNDAFPRILVIRGKDLLENKNDAVYQYIFGPFPNGTLFNDALKIIRKLFQYYDTRTSIDTEKNKMLKGKIDFNRQIGLYPETCTQSEYTQTIRHLRLFFEGKKTKIISDLEKQMMQYAKQEAFEKANVVKKKIFALKHIQDISLIKDESRAYKDDKNIRIEAYDIAHLGGKDVVGVMVVLVGNIPEKNSYRKFTIKGFKGADDTRALREVLERRFTHTEWKFPDLIVVDGSTAQRNTALAVLKKLELLIPVVGVVKDETHNPKRIIGAQKIIREHTSAIFQANAEAHRFAIAFHRRTRNTAFIK